VARQPEKPAILDGGVILPSEQMAMDPSALDNVVRGKGAPLIHFRALRCPVGLVDPTDVRRPHPDHSGCSNGFLYVSIGRVTASLSSNATQQEKRDYGWYDGSTIVAVFPRFYDSDPAKRVLVKPYDRFYLEQEDLLTGTWDLTQRRKDGHADRLEFPAVQVEHIIDSQSRRYGPEDFEIIEAGDIQWKSNRGPALGQCYSIWYQYRPYYIVERLIHELRLFPTHGFVDTNEIKMERLGFGAVLQREFVHRTQTPDDQAPDKQNRQKLPPEDDEFGPR